MRYRLAVGLLMALMLPSADAGAQEKTVCDSPCKMLLLPLAGSPDRPMPNSNPLAELQGRILDAAVYGRARRDTIYFEFQVEKPVKPVPNGVAPHYPDSLKAAKVEGQVLMSFVVDTMGFAELGSMKILRATDSLFTEAAIAVLPRMRFEPAEIKGRKVRQLVQQPFVFTVSK